VLVLASLLCLAVAAGCGGGNGGAGSGDDEPSAGGADDATGSAATGRVLALGEEPVLADLLALGIRPIASTANVVVDGGFVGLDGADVEGIEPLLSTEPNIEHLASLQPEVVVASEFVVDYLGRDVLEGLGALVVVPDDPEARMLALGDAFDRRAEAEGLVAALDDAIASGRASLGSLPEASRTVSVATVYPGPSVAAWVAGPIDIPDTLVALGFTLHPAAGDVTGAEGGRVYLSREQVGLLDADTLVAMQSDHVEGEAAAIAAMADDPLWADLPAVAADRVITVDRLGYPGITGRMRLVDDLVALLGS
jgi:iron complex transport system substrate-binding protein